MAELEPSTPERIDAATSRPTASGAVVSRSWDWVFPVCAVALTSLVFVTTPVTESYEGFDSDGRFYAAMAGCNLPRTVTARLDPDKYANSAPYCYRVLSPALARLLPWDVITDFRVLAYVSDVVSLVILSLVLKRLQLSRALCILGVVFYAGVFWTLKWSFYSPVYIDSQTQMFLLLTIYLTISEHYLILLPVLVASVLQKESLVAYSLFSAVHVLRRPGHRSILLAVLLLGVPLTSALLVKYLVHPHNAYDSLGVVQRELLKLGRRDYWPVLLQASFSGLGLLPVVLLARCSTWLAFLQRHVEWIFYLLISVFFLLGGIDKSRLFLYSLPLVVLMSLQVVKVLSTSGNKCRFVTWVIVAVLLHLFLGGHLPPLNPKDYAARMVPEHSEGQYLRFLAVNCILAMSFLVYTMWSFALRTGKGEKQEGQVR